MNAERKQHVLLVEDDETFAEEFGGFLASFGYEVRHVGTLAGITELVAAETFDVILLDQIVLGQDSIAVIAPIRLLFDGPVIIITNNTEIVDRIIALETGADDFIQKLQPSREILARIRAVMRRTSHALDGASSSHAPMHADHSAQEGVWQLSHRSRTLTTPTGARVALSSAEFDLGAIQRCGEYFDASSIRESDPWRRRASATKHFWRSSTPIRIYATE